MAERSKAPDSRLITFPASNGTGRSGLRMGAWVRIPLLTYYNIFFFELFFYFIENIINVTERKLEVSAIEASNFQLQKEGQRVEEWGLTLFRPDFLWIFSDRGIPFPSLKLPEYLSNHNER